MNNLIIEVRRLIDDTTTPYDFTDAQITRYLSRGISANTGHKDDYSPAIIDSTGHAYDLKYKNIANFSVKDSDGNTISATCYDLDYLNGLLMFTPSGPGYLNITVGFTYHDLHEAVSELWLARAGMARFSGRVKLADEDLPMDKNSREFCIQQYWAFKKNKNMDIVRG
jgi:hypothetical protein